MTLPCDEDGDSRRDFRFLVACSSPLQGTIMLLSHAQALKDEPMNNTATTLSPTFDFIWKNGILMQKVHVFKVEGEMGVNPHWEDVTAAPETDWRPVQVGGKQIKDPTFKTFEQRNGKEPEAKRAGWDHVIEFDGGTDCNDPKKGYGEGYGSYQIDGGNIVRVKFGKGHSNNSAEIRTLIAALRDLAEDGRLGRVLCRGDSQIALNWITQKSGPNRKSSEGFLEAVEMLREEVKRFVKVKGEWRRRNHSVKLFGH